MRYSSYKTIATTDAELTELIKGLKEKVDFKQDHKNVGLVTHIINTAEEMSEALLARLINPKELAFNEPHISNSIFHSLYQKVNEMLELGFELLEMDNSPSSPPVRDTVVDEEEKNRQDTLPDNFEVNSRKTLVP